MSQQMRGGQPMVIMGEDAQRVQDKDAQEYNISAARAVSEAVRSTLGPKGMDKMLVSNIGDVTITNDGVTILQEMEIDNPTAEMIVEVAETQEEEAGDGTTTAVAIAGELLKNAQDLLEQDIHPTAIIRGFDEASTQARAEIDDVARDVDPEDEALLKKVAETSMTGKGAELDKDLLASIIVEAVQAVTVEAEDGSRVVDTEFIEVEQRTGAPVSASELLRGAIVDKDPVTDAMPRDFDDADILLLNEPLEVEETEVDATVSIDDPSELQGFLDKEESQLREKVEKIKEAGADVVFCQKGTDDLIEHFLAQEGILATRRVTTSDMEFLASLLGADIVTDVDAVTADNLGRGSVHWDDEVEVFRVESLDDAHGVTIFLRGSTEHVTDELERGIDDALEVVAQTVTDGRVLPGGGAVEVEVADRLRNYADGVEGREQLAVEAFADSLELVPRVLAENAGLDPIDTLVDLRAAHEDGQAAAGLDVESGNIEDTFEAGVVEPAHAKEQATSSATEAANLVLKIDDIISAGDLSTEGEDDEGGGGPGGPGGPGGMGGMGGMGGAM